MTFDPPLSPRSGSPVESSQMMFGRLCDGMSRLLLKPGVGPIADRKLKVPGVPMALK
jgi:hypothetical protein